MILSIFYKNLDFKNATLNLLTRYYYLVNSRLISVLDTHVILLALS